jgi:sensor histidine kinase YesM
MLREDARAEVLLINAYGDTLMVERQLASGALFRRKYLEPGEYQLLVSLRQNNQVVDQRSLTLVIPKLLTESWWFFSALVALVLGLIILLLRVRYIQTRNKLEREEIESALQRSLKEQESLRVAALVSTLNPHFITNVMQWIQSTLRQQGDPAAIVEITDRLSSNIRTMFVNSYQRQAGHELRKEFQMIRYYLESVNLQYEDRYEFRLPPAEEIERLGDYQVLLLQLQVHVENAVDHGLRLRREATGIKVELTDDEDYLYLAVEDDGAGFTRAARSAKIGSRKGRKMLDELQHIFNQKNAHQITTRILTDRFPDPHKPGEQYGTRIELTIPKDYSYDLENPGG